MKKKNLSFILLFLIALLFFSATFQSSSSKIYKVDSIKSKIYWKCDNHNGIFPLDSGKVILNKGMQEGIFYINLSQIQVLDLDSAHYETAKLILENTLKNEFFEVEKYPLTYFHLQKVEPQGNKFLLEGDLFMHGENVCIKFSGNLNRKHGKWHLTTDTIIIDRTDWGIYRLSPQRPYPDDEHGWTVSDTVKIFADIWFH